MRVLLCSLIVAACGAVSAVEPVAIPAASIQQRLQEKKSLSFPRNTLERAINLLAEEVGVPMVIVIDDLQREGITKNQSFRLDEEDKPGEEILRAILLTGSPDGKLVYVVRETDEGPSIAITTRAAAAERKEELPATLR